MNFRNYIKTLLTLIFSLPIIILLTKSNISATTISSADIKIDITSSSQTFVTVNINFTNTSPELVSSYNYIAPFRRVSNVNVKLNSSPIEYAIETAQDPRYSIIKANFASSPVRSGITGSITYTFQAQSTISQRNNLEYLFIPGTKDIYTTYSLSYPASFGAPSFVLPSEYNLISTANTYQLNFNSNKSAVLAWGNEYSASFSSNTNIINNSEKNIKTLYQIPANFDNQDILLKEDQSNSAWFDSSGNHFLSHQLNSAEQKEIEIIFQVTKKLTTFNSIKPISDLTKRFDEINSFVGLQNINYESQNKIQELERVHDQIIEKFQISQITNTNFASYDEYIDTLTRKRELNSFDLCFVITSYAQKLGISTAIEYGYIILPDTFGNEIEPHFWCKILNNNEVILLDPYFEALTGIKYFGSKSDYDRVKFGVWDTNQDYNKAIGLLDQQGYLKTISFTDIAFENNTGIEVDNQSIEINSGLYQTVELKIQNRSDTFVPLNSISNFSLSNRNNNLLKPAIKPGENIIQISGLFESNPFSNYVKNIDLTFNLGLNNQFVINLPLRTKSDNVILIIMLTFTIIILFVISFLIWKLRNSLNR